MSSDILGTRGGGIIGCEARLAPGGRTTQVWDARVTGAEDGNLLALFRCTQLILYPR